MPDRSNPAGKERGQKQGPGPNSEARAGGPSTGRSDDTRTRWAFLADASRTLSESLDYETVLERVAGLSLPYLGTWSIVDLTSPDGTIRRLAVVHPDPEMQVVARELKEGWPPQREDPIGISAVARTGESELVEDVTDDMLVEVARNEENLQRLRTLGISSVMTVPMAARGNILGAITFIVSDPERRFTPEDLSLAQDLAHRCAFAIDNARLHRAASTAAEAELRRLRAVVADQVKGEFLATASHEMRTPLNAIAGYVELLAMEVAGPLNNRQRDFVGAIDRSGEQLLSVVEDMLNFVRVSSERVSYETTDFLACRIVDDIARTYGPALEDAGLTLEVHCPAGLQARADPPKVWQILLNLLSNSRKFTDPGGEVRIDCRLAEGGAQVEIAVRDTGCGIPEDKLEAIFEPFVQGDTGLSRTAEGLGLGLAISRHLARGMEGDLTVASPPGEGCAFLLTLPAGSG
jgi:signal transduction histidine kinase